MIRPFIYERADTCPVCKSERSIEAYTYNNKPIRFSLAIDRNISVKNKDIRYLKCNKCKAEFIPNWIFRYPIPMTDNSFELFMAGYKTALKESETG